MPLWALILGQLSGVAERSGSGAELLGANPGVAPSVPCHPGKETPAPRLLACKESLSVGARPRGVHVWKELGKYQPAVSTGPC